MPRPSTPHLAWRDRRAILAWVSVEPFALHSVAGRPLTLAWIGLLIGGVAMAIWLGVEDPLPGDRSVGRWIQNHDPLGKDALRFLRDVGSMWAAIVMVILAVAVEWTRNRRWTTAATLGFVAGLALIAVLKSIVDRPHPTPLDFVQVAGHDSPSFPSGHVMGMLVASALVLWVTWRGWVSAGWSRWLRIVPTVWATGMILVQPWVSVATGVHWPSDSLGGIVWGLIFVIPAIALLEQAARHDAASQLH